MVSRNMFPPDQWWIKIKGVTRVRVCTGEIINDDGAITPIFEILSADTFEAKTKRSVFTEPEYIYSKPKLHN